MPISLPIGKLCCHVTAAVFSFSVSQTEMRDLGLIEDSNSPSPAVRLHALHVLRSLCRSHPHVAGRLSDTLDLKYLDTVLTIRQLDADSLCEVVNRWIDAPRGEALPGLIWALCSDPRPESQRAGMALSSAATWLGCQSLIS